MKIRREEKDKDKFRDRFGIQIHDKHLFQGLIEHIVDGVKIIFIEMMIACPSR